MAVIFFDWALKKFKFLFHLAFPTLILALYPLSAASQYQKCTLDFFAWAVFEKEYSRESEIALKDCIKSGRISPSSRDKNGQTLLHTLSSIIIGDDIDIAAHLRVLSFALSQGHDVNARDEKARRTPLHRAGSREVVELLLQAGANPNLRDARGRFPVHSLTDSWNVKTGTLEALLEAGVRVNVLDNDGSTPLHVMAYASRLPEGYELLLSYGVDPSVRNFLGETAYDRLVEANYPELKSSRVLGVLKAASLRNVDGVSHVNECDHVYVGKEFEARGGMLRLNQRYVVEGVSERAGLVTIRGKHSDYRQEITCGDVP